MAGLFIGAMLFLFSALAMGAVGRAAMSMIQEVRRQFHDIPALKTALEMMNRNEGKSSDEWSEEERNLMKRLILPNMENVLRFLLNPQLKKWFCLV